MPVFRYFLVVGCCLLGLIFAAGWMWPDAATPIGAQSPATAANAGPDTASAAPTNLGSLDDWRRAEDRLIHKKQAEAVIYPDVATLAPTSDRLQWERQLRYLPENHVYDARAEMPKTAEPPKVAEKAEKKAPAHRRIARTQPNARFAANVDRTPRHYETRNTGWDPFGLFD